MITVYSKNNCPYCTRAKQLFDSKNIAYQEIDVIASPDEKEIMMQRANRHTVPQIFINDMHIGGCDDLYALDHSVELEQLLK